MSGRWKMVSGENSEFQQETKFQESGKGVSNTEY